LFWKPLLERGADHVVGRRSDENRDVSTLVETTFWIVGPPSSRFFVTSRAPKERFDYTSFGRQHNRRPDHKHVVGIALNPPTTRRRLQPRPARLVRIVPGLS
jgi:hypothetical protein